MTEKQEIKLEEVGGKSRALLFSQKPSVGATITAPCPPHPNQMKGSLNQPDKLEIDIVHLRLQLSRIGINLLIQLGKLENYILHVRLFLFRMGHHIIDQTASSSLISCICTCSSWCGAWGLATSTSSSKSPSASSAPSMSILAGN